MRDCEPGYGGLHGQDHRGEELDRLMTESFGPEWTVLLGQLLVQAGSPLAHPDDWVRATHAERCDALMELLCRNAVQTEVDPVALGLFYVDDVLMVPSEYRAAVHRAHTAGLFVIEPAGPDC
ncbi:hypothetical protein [Lentzea sp. E54]|uniref:hypothetical protein n=1 Tax=Lentzea xerophila TaxID=3435883 RepID=UPI003DA558E2